MVNLRIVLRRAQLTGKGGLFDPFEAVSLRFTAAFRHRFGEVGEQDGEPQPETHGGGKSGAAGDLPACHGKSQQGGEQTANPDDKHHRVTPLYGRAQFFHGVQQGLTHQRRLQQG